MDFSPFLYTGTTLANFHSAGIFPILKLRLKRMDNGYASEKAHFLRIRPLMPSGPNDLLAFKFRKIVLTVRKLILKSLKGRKDHDGYNQCQYCTNFAQKIDHRKSH